MTTTQTNSIQFTRVNSDTNGNPRYVCHFLSLVNDKDRELADKLEDSCKPFRFSISHLYDIAVSKAHKIGGKRFHNKQYGGGIVFKSYNIQSTGRDINELKTK